MKRFRMKKQKVVKPDGRWMYMYTFEEETEPHSQAQSAEEHETEHPTTELNNRV
ncbi:MAG: hypothetical protein RMM08_13810 [Armatimonadota bacterium]|nr:hypothetical protein [Armatimonadota bacterium]